jgi:DNA polymerase III sliding clamp (beta) subunit (PCNA family)
VSCSQNVGKECRILISWPSTVAGNNFQMPVAILYDICRRFGGDEKLFLYTDHLNIVITGLQFIDRSERVYNLAQMGAKSYPLYSPHIP